jgi:hypothetical protein
MMFNFDSKQQLQAIIDLQNKIIVLLDLLNRAQMKLRSYEVIGSPRELLLVGAYARSAIEYFAENGMTEISENFANQAVAEVDEAFSKAAMETQQQSNNFNVKTWLTKELGIEWTKSIFPNE